jgi:hypothetical protein
VINAPMPIYDTGELEEADVCGVAMSHIGSETRW